MSTFIGDAVKQNLSFTAWFYDCQNGPFYRDILVATFGQAKYSGALPSSWPPPGALHPGLCWGLRPQTPVMGSRSPQDPTLCSSKLTFNKSWPPINEGDLWVWVTRATWFAWTNSRHIGLRAHNINRKRHGWSKVPINKLFYYLYLLLYFIIYFKLFCTRCVLKDKCLHGYGIWVNSFKKWSCCDNVLQERTSSRPER